MDNLENTLAVITAIGVGLSGPVTAIVEAVKATGLIPSNYLKLISLLIGTTVGIVFGFLFPGLGAIGAFAAGGFTAGIAASAIYDNVTTKTTNGGEK